MPLSCTHKCTQVKADTQISHLQSKEESVPTRRSSEKPLPKRQHRTLHQKREKERVVKAIPGGVNSHTDDSVVGAGAAWCVRVRRGRGGLASLSRERSGWERVMESQGHSVTVQGRDSTRKEKE